MPHIRDHPNWWAFLAVDVWGAHATSLRTLQKARDLKVMIAKEEGDSSQVNHTNMERCPNKATSKLK